MSNLATRLTPSDVAAGEAAHLAEQLHKAQAVTIGGETVALSERARMVLGEIFEHLAAGDAVDVVPVTEMLSTSEAAELLRVSRPTLVKLLDSGLIPFEQPGVHRRVSRAAIDTYRASRAESRRSALHDLSLALDPDAAEEYVATR